MQGEIQDYLSPEDYIIQIWTTKDDVAIAELINKVILCLILYLIFEYAGNSRLTFISKTINIQSWGNLPEDLKNHWQPPTANPTEGFWTLPMILYVVVGYSKIAFGHYRSIFYKEFCQKTAGKILKMWSRNPKTFWFIYILHIPFWQDSPFSVSPPPSLFSMHTYVRIYM